MMGMFVYPYSEKVLDSWNTTYYYIQPKLNGFRCIYINGKLYSKYDKEILSAPHIIKKIRDCGIFNYKLDGELYIPNMSLQKIRSFVMRKNISSDYERIKFFIFDIIENKSFEERCQILRSKIFPNLKSPLVKVPTFKSKKEDIWKYLDVFMDKGFEGIIIRDPNGFYKEGRRSLGVLKYKPMKTDEYKIVELLEEKDKFGNLKGILGALKVVDDSGNSFKVGSGFITDKEKIELWKNRDKLIGKYVEIRYPYRTEKGIPFQPVIIKFK